LNYLPWISLHTQHAEPRKTTEYGNYRLPGSVHSISSSFDQDLRFQSALLNALPKTISVVDHIESAKRKSEGWSAVFLMVSDGKN
jgi:hypothetical protein